MYGKRKESKISGNTVFAAFENGSMEIQVITEQIVRIFSQVSEERPMSKAIEGDKSVFVPVEMKEEESCLTVTTPCLLLKIYDEAKVDIYTKEGQPLCLDYRGERHTQKFVEAEMLKIAEMEGHKVTGVYSDRNIQIRKQMDGDEAFYGLGDKTTFLNKRGYEFINWNTDNPDPHLETFQSLYKSIPFFITLKENAVFGIFFDNTFRTYFDLGKECDQYYGFSADEGNLDYYFIYGNTMKEVVHNYTYLTGTAPLPQIWTLGYHQSRWGYKCEKDIREIAESMQKYNIPCDTIHMDIDYMERFKVFTVDSSRFPDLAALSHDLHEMGMHLVTIMDPGVKIEKGYSVYEEGVEKGYFAKNPDGSVYENAVWPGPSVFPDFGNPKVRKWWGENHKVLLDAGIDGIWNDMNEPASFHGELPPEVVFHDEDRECNHEEMHNIYGHEEARATYTALKEMTGKRPFVITRACYSGSQKYALGWTGDNHSIWTHLRVAIPQLCSLGLSGMPFVGTDIGGFNSDGAKELMCRWIEVGCFSPFCRNHSALGTRQQEPWTFDEETRDIYRKYLTLRYELLPYFYDLFRIQELEGTPMMRPLVLEYEKDKNTHNLNDEFMLGDSILVSPVVQQGAVKKMVYLPEGDWYDYWTGEQVKGNQYLIRDAALDMCPIYVKAGSVIPKYKAATTVSQEINKDLILEVYPGEGEYIHYQDNGEDFKYQTGEYNLYRFKLNGEKVSMEMPHKGYDKVYGKVIVRCGEKEEIIFQN